MERLYYYLWSCRWMRGSIIFIRAEFPAVTTTARVDSELSLIYLADLL